MLVPTIDDPPRAVATVRRLGRRLPLLACAVLVVACPEPEGGDGSDSTSTTQGSTGTSQGTGPADTSTSGPTTVDPTTLDTGDSTGPQDTDDTTGPPLSCGDGEVQPPEACDDGNAIDADGCNTDCTISGSILFEHSQASGAGGADRAFGVAEDGSSNAYLGGDLAQATVDTWIRQYTPDDALGFTVVTDSGAGDGARGVAAFGDRIYVAGHGAGNLTLASYDADGTPGWSVDYAGPGTGTDVGFAAAVDAMGSVIVAGVHRVNYFDGVSNIPHDNIFARKYGPTGVMAWTLDVGGPLATGEDQARGVATDSLGNVIVAGWVSIGGAGRDVWVRKLDPAGAELWTQTYSGVDMAGDWANAVATAPDDSVVVVGHETLGGLAIRWIRKYDPDGNELWTSTWPGGTDEGAEGLGVGIDDAGDIVVTGTTLTAGIDQLYVHKLDPSGTLRWETLIPGMGGGASVGRGIAIAASQRIWVAGERDLGVDGPDLYVARLAP